MLVKTSGEWRPTREWYDKTSGEHRPLTNLYKKVSGSWEEILLWNELPKQDNIWLDLQIDSGIVESSGEVTSWTDSKNSNVFNSTADHRPDLDTTRKLIGLPTVKFGLDSDYRQLYRTGTPTGAPGRTDTHTWLALIIPIEHVSSGYGDTRYIFYTGTHAYGGNGGNMGVMQRWDSGVLHNTWINNSYTTLKGEAALDLWSVLMVTYVPETGFYSWINGVYQGFASFTETPGYIDILKIGTYNGKTRSWGGNMAALISWNGALSADEQTQAYSFMKGKYGL